MITHHIAIDGPRAEGTRVSADLLRNVLDVVIEGSKRAVRIRTQGRSTGPGRIPEWIEAAADFSVELRPGSTTLEIRAPTLLEAAPDEFAQRDAFPEIRPEGSSFEYFRESLEAAVAGDAASPLFDRGLLEVFGNLRKVFGAGAEYLSIGDDTPLKIGSDAVRRVVDLEARIPPPQSVRVAGILDAMRNSDRTFSLLVGAENQRVKGNAEPAHMAQLKELFAKRVVVSGTAHFTPAGGILRVDADRIAPASRQEETLWGKLPNALGREPSPMELRVEQGPRSGLNAVIGKWPGDEDDEEVARALEELS